MKLNQHRYRTIYRPQKILDPTLKHKLKEPPHHHTTRTSLPCRNHMHNHHYLILSCHAIYGKQVFFIYNLIYLVMLYMANYIFLRKCAVCIYDHFIMKSVGMRLHSHVTWTSLSFQVSLLFSNLVYNIDLNKYTFIYQAN